MTPDAGFAPADWMVLAAYVAVVVAIGAAAVRRSAGRAGGTTADELFLAGRGMPMWAAAVSVLATSLSAATFIGGPQLAYGSNLTYFSANLGGLIAVILVATIFIPAYYRAGVTSIYELLGMHFGAPVRVAASGLFMLGRVFASGARLFMVALPFALVVFGNTSHGSLLASIALITVVATAYTALGGIRAVIWTDVLQAVVVVATVGVALALLWSRIPADAGTIIETLRNSPDGDKLEVLSLSDDPRETFTLWTALIGFTLFNLAAFGTDQDLTQRMLTCRTPRAGAWSAVVANLLSWPVVLLFLLLGLLLYVFYQCPAIMGDAAPGYSIDDTRRVFLEFILAEMPHGLRGLMIAGLFAAAMSSLDSALGAMASTTVADFYRTGRRREGGADRPARKRREAIVSRLAIVGWAFPLAGFACLCVFWQEASGQTLIVFALSVMLFAYAGLLAVFLTALLTSRGNTWSALAALATGFVAVLMMKPFAWAWWAPMLGLDARPVAFPWQMVIATSVAMAVCCAGRRPAAAIRRASRA